MCVWTLAKGQRNSEILLEPPKPGEGNGGICGAPGPLGLQVLSLSSRWARASPGFMGPVPLPFPLAGARLGPGCLRCRLSRPLPASRGLSAWDRLGRPDGARSPKPPNQAAPKPLQMPSPHQQPSHQGWGPADSSRPRLPADRTLESLWRRALEPIPPSSKRRQGQWRPSTPTCWPRTVRDPPPRVLSIHSGRVLAPGPTPVRTPASP